MKITCGTREARAIEFVLFLCSCNWVALSSVFLFRQLRIERMVPGGPRFLCKNEKGDDMYSFVDIPILG